MAKIIKVSNMEHIEELVKQNDGYCPCAISKSEDTKCMCKEFRDMPVGSICHCGLYQKIN